MARECPVPKLCLFPSEKARLGIRFKRKKKNSYDMTAWLFHFTGALGFKARAARRSSFLKKLLASAPYDGLYLSDRFSCQFNVPRPRGEIRDEIKCYRVFLSPSKHQQQPRYINIYAGGICCGPVCVRSPSFMKPLSPSVIVFVPLWLCN